jgi:hypothetical protein
VPTLSIIVILYYAIESLVLSARSKVNWLRW